MADIRAPWMDGWGGEGGDFDSKTASFYTRLLLNGVYTNNTTRFCGWIRQTDRQTDRSEDISLLD